MKKTVQKLNVLIALCAILFPVLLMAQDPGGFDDDVLDNPVPFDGGVSLLVAAGVGYGIKKVRDNRKKQQVEE